MKKYLPIDFITDKYLYYTGITFILLVRLTFLLKGSRALIDESRYSFSLRALDSLLRKDIKGFFWYLSSIDGRPGAAVVNLVPASIQGAIYLMFNINPDTPISYLIPTLCNYLILCISMVLIYRLTEVVLKDKDVAFVVVLVYSCLVNTNIYVRHLLPYDIALLITLAISLEIAKVDKGGGDFGRKNAFKIGALAMFVFTIYPGYYIVVVIFGILIINWKRFYSSIAHNFIVGIHYLFGVIAVFSLFECTSTLGGVSYLRDSQSLSKTITQGSFEEGFTFIFKYLFEVEGILGIFVIICFLLSFATFFVKLYHLNRKKIFVILVTSRIFLLPVLFLFGFILHAVSSFFMHKTVFYGRLIHLYIPYAVIYCVGVFALIVRPHFKYINKIVVVGALASFAVFSFNFVNISYPRDILYDYNINTASNNTEYVNESFMPLNLQYKSPMLLCSGSTYKVYSGKIILVNCAVVSPSTDSIFSNYKSHASDTCLYENAHFCNFPAYMFEGLDIRQREYVKENKFNFKIYNRF